MSDLVSNYSFSAVGFETGRSCYEFRCEFAVVGVADHSICSSTGSVGNIGFTQTTLGVDTFAGYFNVQWDQAIGDLLGSPTNSDDSFSVQVQCGQGVVAAQ